MLLQPRWFSFGMPAGTGKEESKKPTRIESEWGADLNTKNETQSAAPPLFAVPVTPLPAPSPRPSLRILRFLNLRAYARLRSCFSRLRLRRFAIDRFRGFVFSH